MGTIIELLLGVVVWGGVFLLYVLSERQMTSRFLDMNEDDRDIHALSASITKRRIAA